MHKSFFSRWQGKLKQEFGGRYLQQILLEVLLEDPGVARAIFKQDSGQLNRGKWEVNVTKEWFFDGEHQKRKADLAFLSGTEPLALVEIKCEDGECDGKPKGYQRSKANNNDSTQIEDYVTVANKKGIPFVYLSKYPAGPEEMDKLKRCHTLTRMTWSELATKLEQMKKRGPCTELLMKYLNEVAFGWKEQLDKEAVRLLLRSCCGLAPGDDTRTRASRKRVMAAPDLLATLLQSAAALEVCFRNRVADKNVDIIGRGARIDFYTNLFTNCDQLSQQSDLTIGRYEDVKPDGGSLIVESEWYKTNDKCFLGFQIVFTYRRGGTPTASLIFYHKYGKQRTVNKPPKQINKWVRGGRLTLDNACNCLIECARETLIAAEEKNSSNFRKSGPRAHRLLQRLNQLATDKSVAE